VKSKHGFETTEERSKLMSRIRGTNTKPEKALRKALWALGVRYRLNVKKLPGKPDIVIGKHKLAIFVDGEFWHGYDWKAKKPKIKSDAEYWVKKIEGNMARDQNNNEKLRSQGFLVLRFWEQELRKDIDGCVRQILKAADTRTT
jgi:DNA mismatch endonuclease (patch repair protein)